MDKIPGVNGGVASGEGAELPAVALSLQHCVLQNVGGPIFDLYAKTSK